MGFIGKKELYTILCTGIGDYSSDSLELNVDITPDFVVRNIDKYNFVYKIEVVDGSTLIREFGFPKLESEVVSVITPTWIFEHENNTLKITGSSKSLPDISDANIGDVLTVGENGAEWSAPSGGLTVHQDENGVLSETANTIINALSGGYTVCILILSGSQQICSVVTGYNFEPNISYTFFTGSGDEYASEDGNAYPNLVA